MLAGVLLLACSDDLVLPVDPVAPPPEPVDPRIELIHTVRELVEENNLQPVAAPPAVRDELVALGRSLAFDKILSGNRDVSCMTCHLPATSTGDGKSLPIGPGASGLGPARTHPDGDFTLRHSMALFNLHRVRKFLWGGEIEALANGEIRTPAGAHLTPEMKEVFEFGVSSAPAMFPISAPEEMLGTGNELAEGFGEDHDFTELWSRLMLRLGAIPEYRELFQAAYPGTDFDDMTYGHASNAIMGFIISQFSFDDSPWDLFLQGDNDRLTDRQLEGAIDFMTVGCTNCHQTDILDGMPGNEFHNDALAQFGPGKGDGIDGGDDFGRERVTGDPADRRRFKTAPLRNIELTAPYGHVGQFTTLRGFVEHYNNVDSTLYAYDVTQVDPLLQPTVLDNYDEILITRDTLLVPIRLDEQTVDELIEFLKALTDDAARDLSGVTPSRVPSGLSIDKIGPAASGAGLDPGRTVGDSAPNGIAIVANKLTGGTITATGSTTNAVLTHVAVPTSTQGHKVDGIRPTLVTTGSDAPPPSTDGTKVILTFSETVRRVNRNLITIEANGVTLSATAESRTGTKAEITLATALTATATKPHRGTRLQQIFDAARSAKRCFSWRVS